MTLISMTHYVAIIFISCVRIKTWHTYTTRAIRNFLNQTLKQYRWFSTRMVATSKRIRPEYQIMDTLLTKKKKKRFLLALKRLQVTLRPSSVFLNGIPTPSTVDWWTQVADALLQLYATTTCCSTILPWKNAFCQLHRASPSIRHGSNYFRSRLFRAGHDVRRLSDTVVLKALTRHGKVQKMFLDMCM